MTSHRIYLAGLGVFALLAAGFSAGAAAQSVKGKSDGQMLRIKNVEGQGARRTFELDLEAMKKAQPRKDAHRMAGSPQGEWRKKERTRKDRRGNSPRAATQRNDRNFGTLNR